MANSMRPVVAVLVERPVDPQIVLTLAVEMKRPLGTITLIAPEPKVLVFLFENDVRAVDFREGGWKRNRVVVGLGNQLRLVIFKLLPGLSRDLQIGEQIGHLLHTDRSLQSLRHQGKPHRL